MSGTEGNGANQNRFIGRITALLTALVALNTLVFSCSERRHAREAEVVARAQTYEAFWEAAFRELDGLLRDRPALEALENGSSDAASTGAGVTAANWLRRCELLSQRTVQLEFGTRNEATVPTNANNIGVSDAEIEEFPRVGAIRKRAFALRDMFKQVMDSNEDVGTVCAGYYARLVDEADKATALNEDQNKDKDASLASTSLDDPAAQAAIIGGEASIVMNRSTPNSVGFDIDVFWCDRPRATGAQQAAMPESVRTNIVEAAAFGRQLSDIADARGQFAGEVLGRIRLRRLSVPAQQLTGGPSYPRESRQIRYDESDKVEGSLAVALNRLPQRPQPVPQSFRPTQYYLSAFFCQHGVTPDKPAAAE